MVAFAYEVDRAILIILYLILSALSFSQIYTFFHKRWRKKTSRHHDSKNLIHVSIFCASFFLFLGVIDLGGVFGLYNRYTSLVLVAFGWNFLFLASFFLIFSHFQAHYLALRKEMSMTSFWILGALILIGFVTYLLGQVLSEKYHQERYQTYAMVYVVLELIVIKITDAIGYWKIRTLLIQAVRMDDPKYEASWCCSQEEEDTQQKKTSNGGVDYEGLLRKLWKFHAFVQISGIGFLGFFIWWFSSAFNRLNTPIDYLHPEQFGFDITAHSFLPGLVIYLWWSWIPLRGGDEDGANTGTATNHSSQKKTQMSEPGVEIVELGTTQDQGSSNLEQHPFLSSEQEMSSSVASASSPSNGTGTDGFRFPERSAGSVSPSGIGVHPVEEESNHLIEESPRDEEGGRGEV